MFNFKRKPTKAFSFVAPWNTVAIDYSTTLVLSNGAAIRTSPVVACKRRKNRLVIETRNSIYIQG